MCSAAFLATEHLRYRGSSQCLAIASRWLLPTLLHLQACCAIAKHAESTHSVPIVLHGSKWGLWSCVQIETPVAVVNKNVAQRSSRTRAATVKAAEDFARYLFTREVQEEFGNSGFRYVLITL